MGTGRDVIVVTGAASGIGAAGAQRLSSPSTVTLLVDRNAERLRSVHESLAGSCSEEAVRSIVVDLAADDAPAQVVEAASELGRLRSLFHAAGLSPSMAEWQRIMIVNLVAPARLLEAVRPLITPGMAAVCVASMAAHRVAGVDPALEAILDEPLAPDLLERLEREGGHRIDGSMAGYAWSKLGIRRLVEREALVWGPLGARLTSVSPGVVASPMGLMEFERNPHMSSQTARSPIGRPGFPAEIAAAAAFLLSDAASFITGSDLLVDGGAAAMGIGEMPPDPGVDPTLSD